MSKATFFSTLLFMASVVACSSAGDHKSAHDHGDGHHVHKASKPAANSPYQYEGLYILGHEVNTVILCGQKPAYWVLGDQSILNQLESVHKKMTDKPYGLIYIRFNGELSGKASDGFAADYDGQMTLKKLVSAHRPAELSCSR